MEGPSPKWPGHKEQPEKEGPSPKGPGHHEIPEKEGPSPRGPGHKESSNGFRREKIGYAVFSLIILTVSNWVFWPLENVD